MSNKLVSLIAGPTDKTKIFRFTNISRENYNTHLEELADSLSNYVHMVNIIPDQGVPLDFAKKFRERGGKVIGYVPQIDCESLRKNFSYCDEITVFNGGWSALNTCLSLKGDLITVIGMSPGTMVEISYTKYHKKYLGKKIPILIDTMTVPWTFPESISEELDLRYFNGINQFEILLKQISGANE